MHVLVTGGAGYVGSHTVLALVEAGHRVCVVDDLSAGHREALPAGVRLEVIDLARGERLIELVRGAGFDGAIHFAARALVEESMRAPELYFEANLVGSFRLLEALRAAGVRRLVVSSSCAVYGVPDVVPIPEECPRRPINPYGFTKAAVEQMLEEYRRAHGLGFAALRYFNAAGADAKLRTGEDHHPESHLIPRLLCAARDGAPFTVAGNDYPTPDGTCVRDYVHVDDLAAVHLLALERIQPGAGEFFNVGTGRGRSNLEVLEAARRVTGKAIPHTVGPRRPGDPPALVADTTRMRAHWGWEPRHSSLETILESAWRWHVERPRGFGGMR